MDLEKDYYIVVNYIQIKMDVHVGHAMVDVGQIMVVLAPIVNILYLIYYILQEK